MVSCRGKLSLSEQPFPTSCSWFSSLSSNFKVINALVLGISSDVEPSHVVWIVTRQDIFFLTSEFRLTSGSKGQHFATSLPADL